MGGAAKKRITLTVYLLKANPDPASKGLWSKKEFLARPIGSSGKAAQIKTENHPLGLNRPWFPRRLGASGSDAAQTLQAAGRQHLNDDVWGYRTFRCS